jgi:hypothetical protein
MGKSKLPEASDFVAIAESLNTRGCRSCWFYIDERCCGKLSLVIKLRNEVERALNTDCGEDNVHYKLK